MATQQELEERLMQIQDQLGIAGAFSAIMGGNLPVMNPGDARIGVASWPYDYSVDPDKLLANLEPKELILMAIRASAR